MYISVSQEASQRGAEGLSCLISKHVPEMVQSSAIQVNGGHGRRTVGVCVGGGCFCPRGVKWSW